MINQWTVFSSKSKSCISCHTAQHTTHLCIGRRHRTHTRTLACDVLMSPSSTVSSVLSCSLGNLILVSLSFFFAQLMSRHIVKAYWPWRCQTINASTTYCISNWCTFTMAVQWLNSVDGIQCNSWPQLVSIFLYFWSDWCEDDTRLDSLAHPFGIYCMFSWKPNILGMLCTPTEHLFRFHSPSE